MKPRLVRGFFWVRPAGRYPLANQFRIYMLMVTQAASWTLGYGPYVADYSRYLPHDVGTSTTFWYTYIGNVLGAGFIMLLGAALAAAFPSDLSDTSLTISRLFGPLGGLALIIMILGVLEMNVLNIYSGFMSGVTVFTGFAGVQQLSRSMRFTVMALITAAATAAAVASQERFATFFSDTLIAQVYFIVPWSAINLVDYYWTKRGQYSVPDIYNAAGIYGRFNRLTLSLYGIAIVAQLPFMDMSFYHGPIARRIGADIAWIPALIVPAVLYGILAKRLASPRAA